MDHRIIYYYQTFGALRLLPQITHVHLSALHFGVQSDGQPYIHLNDYYPDSPIFDQVWEDMQHAVDSGIKVIVMVGGAGGGYSSLFSAYDTYYPILTQFLQAHTCITGLDFDIEETVDINDVRKLIANIKRDFPTYTVAMAPLQGCLENDIPGLGGFSYKDLFLSPEGALIDYFNTQFYNDFSVDAFQRVVNNGYPPDMILMGSINGTGDPDVIKIIANQYPTFGGVFSWEYCTTPATWPGMMFQAMNDLNKDNIKDNITDDNDNSTCDIWDMCCRIA
jgi:hypothetical protein